MRNSASRLLNLLQQLEVNKSYADSTAKVLLGRKVHELPVTEKAKIAFPALKILHDTYEDFIRDMRTIYRHQDQAEMLLEALKPVESLVYQTNLDSAIKAIDSTSVALLKVCATSMPEELEVPESEFAELRKCLDSFRELSMNVKPALKNVLLELIRVSEEAIARYEIRGAAGLKKAIKQMWGELAEIWRIQPEDEVAAAQKSTVVEQVKQFILKFDAAYAKAVKYVPLLEQLVPVVLINGPPT